jgi:hydrogenase large subunit
MATITIDPLNRIEGHLKVIVTEAGGVVTDAQCTGTLFRGIENILNRRDPRDAPQICQRICGVCPTTHSKASVENLDTALGITTDPGTHDGNGDIAGYSTTVPANGRIIRNIIQGCDTVMSHITHLYHLSALDFINTSAFPGMAPFLPSYTASDMIDGASPLGSTLVVHYVQALAMRRKMHTAGALFSGRQPIGNAMVPGGVTTLFSSTMPASPQVGTDYDLFGPYNASDTVSKFSSLLMEVRNFINQVYLPDVITVANAYPAYWSQGIGCGRLLSYGDFLQNSTGSLFFKRGVVTGLTPGTFNQADIREYVDYSYYNYGILDPAGLHPWDGKTTPNMNQAPKTTGYSWLKSPRLLSSTGVPLVCEVGPLARMVLTHLSGTQVSVSDADTATGGIRVGGAYTASNLVTIALGAVSQPATALYSALGRHAARALEAKYLADAMAGPGGWISQLTPDAPCYTYKRIPKQISQGVGLVEGPRGALGHWIKIEGRKIAKYQCVVPTTWNASPAHAATTSGSIANRGPAEAALVGSTIGTDDTSRVINILRILHPFDFCIACAVHVVNPEGKELVKFTIGTDGRPSNVSIAE